MSKPKKLSPYVCGILPMGKETPQVVAYFQRLLAMLLADYPIAKVLFPLENCGGEYFRILKRFAYRYPQVDFCIVTHRPQQFTHEGPDSLYSLVSSFFTIENLPCDAKHIHARNLVVLKTIVSRSGLCICNLQSNDPLSAAIHRQMSRRRRLEIFDLAQRLAE